MPKASSRARHRPPRRRPRSWPRLLATYAVLAAALLVGGGLTAAHLENDDSFCASCHTQPESTFFQRSRGPGPVDLASLHTTKAVGCIGCHSGPGISGRVGAMRVGAGDLAAYLAGRYDSPARLTVPIADAHCLKCHADVGDRNAFDNHFHILLPQWQQRDPAHAGTCVECHISHATGGQSQQMFLLRAPTTAVCQRCHTFTGEGG